MLKRPVMARALAVGATLALSLGAGISGAQATSPAAGTATQVGGDHSGVPLPPDAILDGKPLAPSAPGQRRLHAAQDQGLAAPSAAPEVLPTFEMADQPQVDVPSSWWPYRRDSPIPLGQGPRDAANVRMYSIGGTLYDHPVLQAQDGLASTESYRVTNNAAYLNQALADATRLVDKRVESRGAWFYPYPFDFALHGDPNDVITTPWFSAMAQGQALSLFIRLHDATGDEQWLTAARMTLASLDLPPVPSDPSVPFVSWVDTDGHLWLEEYAQQPLSKSDRTVNGHLFAAYGLWDAVRALGDVRARQLFAGAAATIRANFAPKIRDPLWISRYCLTHGTPSSTYHAVVVDELNSFQGLTGSSDWSRMSDQLRDDYPVPSPSGLVDFAAGKVAAYRYDAAGNVTATRSLTLSRASAAPADRRQRIHGHGVNYRITAGALNGYWVPESYPSSRLRGVYSGTAYHVDRTAVFAPGVASAYQVAEPSGSLSAPVSVRFASRSSAPFDRSAWVGGRLYVHVTAGVFARRWAPAGNLELR
jgi:hypothetical protein